MRSLPVIAFLVGCGGSAPAVSQLPPTSAAVTAPAQPKAGNAAPRSFAPIDAIAALAPPVAWEGELLSWVIPGQARLDVGGSPIDTAPLHAPELPTTILDHQGSSVRVAIRLDHARFSLWTQRAQLMQIVQRELRVTPEGFAPVSAHDGPGVELRAGAHVRKIGKRDGMTKVRFVGDLEVEGWIPDDGIGERGGTMTGYRGRRPTGRKMAHVASGTIVRAAPAWNSAQLAVVNRGYMLDIVAEADPDWIEVMYADGFLALRGFYKKFGPPGRTHRLGVDPETAPLLTTPNAKVASGTCLYARAQGEPIGYIVGDRDVSLEPAAGGWSTLGIDTPYGALLFAAKGRAANELATCAPASAVPPSKLSVP